MYYRIKIVSLSMKNRYHRANLFVKFGDEKYESHLNIKEEVMNLELEFIKKFNRSINVEHKLNNCSTGVLNYYLLKMPKNNKVHTHDHIRKEIINFIIKTGGKEYTDSSIRKAIVHLNELRILLSTDFRGTYYVNPLLYSKTNESDRKQIILDLSRDKVLIDLDFKPY